MISSLDLAGADLFTLYEITLLNDVPLKLVLKMSLAPVYHEE
jgi:hypothetical protein